MAENKEKTSVQENDAELENTSAIENTAEEESVEATESASGKDTNDKKDKKDKNENASGERSESKSGGLKALFKSRKMRHGSLSVILTAVGIAIVILINVITALLIDRFPELKVDFTANNAYALSADTEEYMSHLDEDVTLYIVADEKEFEATGKYFVQAKNLLDKMVSKSNGKFKVEFVDTTENPNFTQKYPNIDWKTKANVGVIVCGDQYKGLTVEDCFTYDEDYYSYYGTYNWTGTTIEQATVKGALNVTTKDKVVVDVLTGEGESDYDGVTSLLTDNAYQVNEVSLLTGELDKDARAVIIYAPQADLSDKSAEALSNWLENDGKYGKTLIYVPNADPRVTELKTPNIDDLVSKWGMELNKGFVYETDVNHRLNGSPMFAFIADYTDYYKENLKNSNLPVVTEYANGITIKDESTAHALLQTSDKAGVYPLDADESFDPESGITGEPIAIAAEGKKAGTEEYSNVIVFSSKAMLSASDMSYPSFNNAAYFMNIMNTITEKEDDTVVIEAKTMEDSTLGEPVETTSNAILVIFVFVIPAAILITGIVLWVRRRNR